MKIELTDVRRNISPQSMEAVLVQTLLFTLYDDMVVDDKGNCWVNDMYIMCIEDLQIFPIFSEWIIWLKKSDAATNIAKWSGPNCSAWGLCIGP